MVGPASFYIVRLLLGAAEAGFFPGITFFLAAWFPAQYRAQVLAWFLVAISAIPLYGAGQAGWGAPGAC